MANLEYIYESSFLVKRGFAADWAELNPVLRQGEIGFIIDKNAIKIGDGVTLWNELELIDSRDTRFSEYGFVIAGQKDGVELGEKATAEGDQVQALGKSSHAEGSDTTASGDYSHAEGNGTIAYGSASHSEGSSTVADANYSHAEGETTEAKGESSHAEGSGTVAIANYSHAEGHCAWAEGEASHAEGEYTTASGHSSHAEGSYTTAAGRDQHVSGRYNKGDYDDKYAFIIGNGTDANNRNNAFMVEWSGDAKLDGYLDIEGLKGKTLTRDLYVGGAYDVNGNWDPKGAFIADHTPLSESIKNSAYIHTLKVPKESTYWLVLPEGSNYLFKMQVTEVNGQTHILDVSTDMPLMSAGAQGDRTWQTFNNYFDVYYSSKTRVDSSTKTFSDGYTGSRRLNFQAATYFDDNKGYPLIKFYANSAAEVKLWWVAGENNRYFAIYAEEGSGSSRLEVSGNFVAHGKAEFDGSVNINSNLIVGADGAARLTVTGGTDLQGELEVEQTVTCGGLKCEDSAKIQGDLDLAKEDYDGDYKDYDGARGNIRNIQAMDVYGTANFHNNTYITPNTNRDDMVTIPNALNEALNWTFKSRLYLYGNELDKYFNNKCKEYLGIDDNFSNRFKTGIQLIQDGTVSSSILVIDENRDDNIVDFDSSIELSKDLTIMGLGKDQVKINFEYTGDPISNPEEDRLAPSLFKINLSDIKLGFVNIILEAIYFKTIEGYTKYPNFLISNYMGLKIYCDNLTIDSHTKFIFEEQAKLLSLNNCDLGIDDGYGHYGFIGEVNELYTTNMQTGSDTSGLDDLTVLNYAQYPSTFALGIGAKAEGTGSIAIGYESHAQGGYFWNESRYGSSGALAVGPYTHANGQGAVAQGYRTQAMGNYSHAEGLATIANGENQHVQGKYNLQDVENKYAHIVGNGKNNFSRSNAYTLDWQGNSWYAGDVYTGGTSQNDENAKKLATEEFVTNTIANSTPEVNLQNYATKQDVTDAINNIEHPQVDLTNYATKQDVTDAINNVQHPQPDLTNYATKTDVSTAIQENAYTLPIATTDTLGGIKVGEGLDINEGVLSVKEVVKTELYLLSPSGIKFRITVSDVGALLVEQVEENV